MNRRSFTQSLGSAAVFSALGNLSAQAQHAGAKPRLYRIEYLYLRQGTQGNRIHEFLASQMPLLAKNTQALGVFNVVIGSYIPATVVLCGFAGLQEMEAADDRIRRNPEYQSALDKMERLFV